MNNYELVFLDFDNMENTHGNARYTRRVPLRAADDEEAKLTASKLWSEIREKTHDGWDGRNYPREPFLHRPIEWWP